MCVRVCVCACVCLKRKSLRTSKTNLIRLRICSCLHVWKSDADDKEQMFIANRAFSPYSRIWRADEYSKGEATALNVTVDLKQSGFLDTLQNRARPPLSNYGTHALRNVCAWALYCSDDQNTGEMQLCLKRHFRR